MLPIRTFLHDERAFMAVLPHLAAIARRLDPQRARPINRVESMGAPRNTVRRLIVDAAPVALGVHAIGDALCHTNPGLGWGASLAVTHASALADALAAHPHDAAQVVVLDQRVWPLAWDCYRAAVEADESRSRWWRGETTGPDTAENDWPRFRASVVGRAATLDPVVYRAYWRAISLLDPPSLLRGRSDVLERARRAVAANPLPPQPAAGPSREEFLAIPRAAVTSATAPA